MSLLTQLFRADVIVSTPQVAQAVTQVTPCSPTRGSGNLTGNCPATNPPCPVDLKKFTVPQGHKGPVGKLVI
jgi:hypothetical protein